MAPKQTMQNARKMTPSSCRSVVCPLQSPRNGNPEGISRGYGIEQGSEGPRWGRAPTTHADVDDVERRASRACVGNMVPADAGSWRAYPPQCSA